MLSSLDFRIVVFVAVPIKMGPEKSSAVINHNHS